MTALTADDANLVARLRHGDASAARELYERHGGALLRFGMAMAGMAWGAMPLAAQAISMGLRATSSRWRRPAAADRWPVPRDSPAAEPRADTVKDAPFSGVGTTEVVTNGGAVRLREAPASKSVREK